MTNQHPITPPPELVEEWIAQVWHEGTPVQVSASDLHLASKAAEWGARYGHQPAPPAEGEVAELVAELRSTADGLESQAYPQTAALITRAAELLEQHHPEPVPVSERLPEPNTKVLAHYFNDLGKGRTICAIWVSAKTRSDSYGDDDFTEYDEESDTFYWPEGWYEAIENWDDLGYVKVDEGEVIFWQPLPKWPTNALPLPAKEVQP